VAVDRFAIGFGRPLFSRTDRHGIEWRFGWIPLGGYVRFAGDAEASSSVPDAEALEAMKKAIRERRAQARSRLSYAMAGSGAGGGIAVPPSDAAIEAQLQREGALPEEAYFHFKPVWVRALVVVAGPVANFLLAIALFTVLLASIGERVDVPRIGLVESGSPAARAGFHPGDLITGMDNRAVENFSDLTQYVALRANKPIHFTVQRDGRQIEIFATPERRVSANPAANGAKLGRLGLGSSVNRADVRWVRHPLPQAFTGAIKRTWSILDTTVFYIGRIITGQESGDQLGGPLRIASVSGQAAQAGAEGATDLGHKLLGASIALLSLAAVLSVGIGFMNLLPVPVLDGGHLLFYAYEALARRPLGARVQAAGYRVGLALLLALMLFATWNDLQQLSVFKFLGRLFS
ncbi:MAG: RIP metalloprotease, partial [Asticcacaulis sp.]|nr:RIP metalloprotease [Asticcacaulis sp.]